MQRPLILGEAPVEGTTEPFPLFYPGTNRVVAATRELLLLAFGDEMAASLGSSAPRAGKEELHARLRERFELGNVLDEQARLPSGKYDFDFEAAEAWLEGQAELAGTYDPASGEPRPLFFGQAVFMLGRAGEAYARMTEERSQRLHAEHLFRVQRREEVFTTSVIISGAGAKETVPGVDGSDARIVGSMVTLIVSCTHPSDSKMMKRGDASRMKPQALFHKAQEGILLEHIFGEAFLSKGSQHSLA